LKLITRNTDYAIRALCCIAGQNKDIISADYLVKSLGMPRPFLRRILQSLKKEGLLNSYKGKGGGFCLAVQPKKINVIHIMKIFQGHIKINECNFKKKRCPKINHCILKNKVDEIEEEVVHRLEKITIDSLLENKNKKRVGENENGTKN